MGMGRVTYRAMQQFDPAFYRGMPTHVLLRTLHAGAHPNLGRSMVMVDPDLPAPVPAQLESVRQLPAGAVQSTHRFGAAPAQRQG